jgi:hypothetical protein
MKSTTSLAGAALACLLLGLVSCTMAPRTAAPRATVDRFLDFYFHEYGSGLPDAAQRATLRPLLTDGLNQAFERAAAAERCAKERSRGQEPPLVQGDVFSSLFEKATAVAGHWLIDDFVHGGDWQFTVRGSMKAMLQRVAELCASPGR